MTNRYHAQTVLEENVPSNEYCDVTIVILYSHKKANKKGYSPLKKYPWLHGQRVIEEDEAEDCKIISAATCRETAKLTKG